MNNFKELPLVFWQLSFDDDCDSYIYNKIEQIIDAITNFVSINVPSIDDQKLAIDHIVAMVLDVTTDDNSPKHGAIVEICNKQLHIRRISLDKYTSIHKVLCECYKQVDDNLKIKIQNLFQQSS